MDILYYGFSCAITNLAVNELDVLTVVMYVEQIVSRLSAMDFSPYNQNFDLGKSGQIFHHSLKEHHKISNIPKFRCEML